MPSTPMSTAFLASSGDSIPYNSNDNPQQANVHDVQRHSIPQYKHVKQRTGTQLRPVESARILLYNTQCPPLKSLHMYIRVGSKAAHMSLP